MAGLGDDSDKIALTDAGTEVGVQVPSWPRANYRLAHPIPQLQGPLEETILDAQSPPQVLIPLDAAGRRKQLLEDEVYERTCSGRWKPRQGDRYHPLWKLIAQLSFGLHLLANNLTKSETKSVRTLQGLINELDGFLQRTVEDFQLTSEDVSKRIDLLEVPLRHVKVFDAMLENQEFCQSIVEIYANTEFVVGRWSTSVQDALKDVEKGLHGVGTIGQYIRELDHSSAPRPATFDAVLRTMFANVHGWNRTFLYLRLKGVELAQSFERISQASLELQSRVAFASQKSVARPAATTVATDGPVELDSAQPDASWSWEPSSVSGGPSIKPPLLYKPIPIRPRTLQPIPEDKHDDQPAPPPPPPPPFPTQDQQQQPQPERTALPRRRNSFAEDSETPGVVLPRRPSSAATFRGAPRKEASRSPQSTTGWTDTNSKAQESSKPTGPVSTNRPHTSQTKAQNELGRSNPEPSIRKPRLSLQSLRRSEISKSSSLRGKKSVMGLLLRIFSIKSSGRSTASTRSRYDLKETGSCAPPRTLETEYTHSVQNGPTLNPHLPVPAT